MKLTEDRLFGFRRMGPEFDILDRRFKAVATAEGYGDLLELDRWSVPTYQQQVRQRAREKERGIQSGFKDLPPWEHFAEYKERREAMQQESHHWGLLLSLGTNVHGSGPADAVGKKPEYFLAWGDGARTMQIYVDKRRSKVGDFSKSALLIQYFFK